MQEGVRNLLRLATGVAAVGLMAAMVTAEGLEVEDLTRNLLAVAHASLGSGLWLVLTEITAGLAALVGLLATVHWILDLTQKKESHQFAAIDRHGLQESIDEARRRIETCLLGEQPNVIAAFSELIRAAVSVAASDIHLSPSPDAFRITFRVHGTLHDVCTLPPQLAVRLTARAKVLAQLDTHIHGTPQDGKLVLELDGARIDARVSCLPTEGGERVVLRLVRGGRKVPDLNELGFSEEVIRGLNEVLSKPQGLFFVTAPVGSGKTTTLYSALQHIVTTRGATTSIVTLEDPVELELPFATQTQMHTRSGMTFASTLRSVLRQDPNVLMVGEIRDQETADVAAQAGLTGHLILTTVHGESAAAPFARLGELQVEPFVLASATVGCLSQRLVRTLCTACRRETEPEPLLVDRFRQRGFALPPGKYFEPVGCDYCERLGFTGRVPIVELLLMGPETRKAVHDRMPSNGLYAIAVEHGMTPLLQNGLAKALRGETSLTEVLRVAG